MSDIPRSAERLAILLQIPLAAAQLADTPPPCPACGGRRVNFVKTNVDEAEFRCHGCAHRWTPETLRAALVSA